MRKVQFYENQYSADGKTLVHEADKTYDCLDESNGNIFVMQDKDTNLGSCASCVPYSLEDEGSVFRFVENKVMLSDIKNQIEAYIKLVGDKEVDHIGISTSNVNCSLKSLNNMHIIYIGDKAKVTFNG